MQHLRPGCCWPHKGWPTVLYAELKRKRWNVALPTSALTTSCSRPESSLMLTVWFHSALVAQSQVPSTSQNFRASSAHVAKDECQRASTGHQEADAKCFICRRLAELPCHECAATLRGEISEIDQNPERAAAAPHSFVLRALHRPVKAIADQLPDLDGGLCVERNICLLLCD